MTRDVLLAPADNVRLVELCGPLDQHLHQIESRLGVEVRRRRWVVLTKDKNIRSNHLELRALLQAEVACVMLGGLLPDSVSIGGVVSPASLAIVALHGVWSPESANATRRSNTRRSAAAGAAAGWCWTASAASGASSLQP